MALALSLFSAAPALLSTVIYVFAPAALTDMR